MSGKFDGFSEDDISKLTTSRSTRTKKTVTFNGRGIQRMPDNIKNVSDGISNLTRNDMNFDRKGTKLSTVNEQDKCISNMNENSNLSIISAEESIHFRPLSSKIVEKQQDVVEEPCDESILHVENMKDNPPPLSSLQSNQKNKTCCESSSKLSAVSPFRGVSLKDFESQRKLIEEQNKQKKEMLYKAIELHSQKTAAEVKKIEQIKAELAKLDTDLAVDVAILRKQIEAACIHYANIQKQYDRVESQFLKAKLDLHNASEKKELLTEHLCTVIAHNEDRKAKKLSELMEKVGISPSGQLEN